MLRNPRAKQPKQPGHPQPVDTYEKVVDSGLNPVLYGSCSEPVPNKNQGCPAWALCNFAHRGKTRPKNKGVRIIKPGGARGVVMACYDAVAGPLMRLETDENFFAEVVAEEGEEILLTGTRPVPGPIGHLATHEPYVEKFKVPAHKGIEDMPGLRGMAAFTKHREQIREERLKQRKADLLNLPVEDVNEDTDETE